MSVSAKVLPPSGRRGQTTTAKLRTSLASLLRKAMQYGQETTRQRERVMYGDSFELYEGVVGKKKE